jgi:hypothetical protein
MLPDDYRVLILKSTPIVGRKLSLKVSSENLSKRLDFPTEESPMSKILKTKSY